MSSWISSPSKRTDPAIGLLQSHHQPANRGLPAARLTHQAERLAPADGEGHVGHRLARVPTVRRTMPPAITGNSLTRWSTSSDLPGRRLSAARRGPRRPPAPRRHLPRAGPANGCCGRPGGSRRTGGAGSPSRPARAGAPPPALVGGVAAAGGEPAVGVLWDRSGGSPGMEAAAHRGLVEAWAPRPAGPRCRVVHAVEQLVGVGLLGDLAGVHDHDPVGAAGDHSHVVGDEDHRHPESVARK